MTVKDEEDEAEDGIAGRDADWGKVGFVEAKEGGDATVAAATTGNDGAGGETAAEGTMLGLGTVCGWLEDIKRGLTMGGAAVVDWLLFFITNSNSEDSLEPFPSGFGGPEPG